MEFWLTVALGALIALWAFLVLAVLYRIERRLMILGTLAQGQVVALDMLLQGLRITPDRGSSGVQAVHKSPLVGRDGGRLS